MAGLVKTALPVHAGASDEMRPPTLPIDPVIHDGAYCSDEDKAVVVPTTAELMAFPDGASTAEALSDLLIDAIGGVQCQDDWARQYESIIMIRRVVVHRPLAVPDASVGVMLQSLTVAGDDLRSALVKNALLALAECFEYLGRGRLEPLVARNPEMLDMLLRRSVCEKKFLRDAAVYAVQRLVQHLACLPLVERAASYATNKNARLCANAAKIIASSLTRLTQEEANGPIAALAQSENAEAVHVVYRALTVFREGKDSSARTQATLSFKLIGEFVGREQFEGGLKASLSRTNQQHMAARILKEVFPSAAGNDAGSQVRRGSLRDRMQLERAH